jgi:hypothetical protein
MTFLVGKFTNECFPEALLLGWVSIVCGCPAQLFVRGKLVCLFTEFVSNIEARQPRADVDGRCSSVLRLSQLKTHSTLKSLCRGAWNLSDLAQHAPSSRAATWHRLWEAKQRTLPRAASTSNRSIVEPHCISFSFLQHPCKLFGCHLNFG